MWSPGEICGIDESAVRVSFPLSPEEEYDIPMDLARNPKRFRVTPGAEVGNQTGPASVPTQTHATPMHVSTPVIPLPPSSMGSFEA